MKAPEADDMNGAYLLTSIEGRINRQPFWIALICLSIGRALCVGRSLELDRQPDPRLSEFRGIRQARPRPQRADLGPGVLIAGSIIFSLLTLLDLVGGPERPNTLFYVLALPLGIMALILLVDFGFRRGTVGPNRYGPDPIEAR
jgi:uncharacterized membrane protein YhaH (DUF805 family)